MSNALSQAEHERINSREYPGTRELCCNCDEPTGRAGAVDDSIYATAKMSFSLGEDGSGKCVWNGDECGPFCETCSRKMYENGVIEL